MLRVYARTIEANGVDPDQTAPTEAVLSWSTLFVKDASGTFHQATCVARSPSSSPNDVPYTDPKEG